MNVWKRNAVVAAVVLFVCGAVYLNWSYQKGQSEEAGKTLGEAELVSMQSADPLLQASPAPSANPSASPAPTATDKSSGYFDTARLNRQQARDSALSILQEAAADTNATESMKAETGEAIQTLADYTVSEAQIENLVTAKGYADCVAFISDGSVSVVVSATEERLTDADVARITEIVTDETGLEASAITIIQAQP
ncbi:SpoIIIAH-like family protein [uncultured Flavonifractor sp.]|uniref:SpoIIIAH-like family protein n=1 Tax=Candidatus Flavonifractor intestinigallinarum TaxID=2838586 RepID=A0A9D2MKU1_9FIRM|nr:SpoIIIAH-like family protein [uncultured Flavonifractor sp.]HJB79469.1 SpoIIIAH-like family protein [Candidatus Flavonifractor intestinigallinarum]